MEAVLARELWHRLETINAVTYFSPECREAPEQLGLKGFWMGYFACRAAPMGPVEAGVVDATFFNFHPARVRRAIPDAWARVDPRDVVVARARAAAAALRRILSDDGAESLASHVLPITQEAIERSTGEGRPLFAANRDVMPPDDPVAVLWQAATTVREHRGDGHVALLTAAGLDGCEVHVLFAACEGVPAELYQHSRGWSADEWDDAAFRLRARGLLDRDGTPTTEGRTLRNEIERRTDEQAARPYETVGAERIGRLLDDIDPAIDQIAASGDIIFPNPMGLPSR